MRTPSAWWRNLLHALWCGGYWQLNIERRTATCGFCGYVDQLPRREDTNG